MKNFCFVILGAGGIGNKFCRAVSLLEQCEVSAVASKSAERAKTFAEKNGVPAYYDPESEGEAYGGIRHMGGYGGGYQ